MYYNMSKKTKTVLNDIVIFEFAIRVYTGKTI